MRKKGENNFWETNLNQTPEEIFINLGKILGKPKNDKEKACLKKISKIISYYFTEQTRNRGLSKENYMMKGSVFNIKERISKEGFNIGRNFYCLELDKPHREIFYAYKENLTPKKWSQIENLDILNQNLVFKYKKWINYNHLFDFYPPEKSEKTSKTAQNQQNS